MKYLVKLFLGLIFYFSNASAMVEAIEKDVFVSSRPIKTAHQDVIYSKLLGQERVINIQLPEYFDDHSSDHRYPVVLVLEDEFFQLTSGIVKHLSSVTRMPDAIVISLPSGIVVPKVYLNGSDNWPKKWKQMPFGGSPDLFVAHLREELFPYLEDKYRAAKYNIVIGFSASSLFAFHTIVQEPDLFQAHFAIASGDILGMGYKEGESFIDRFEEIFKENPNRKINIYATSADSDLFYSLKIGRNMKELAQRMKALKRDNLKIISKILPNESHYGSALPGITEAFNMVFPRNIWSVDFREIIKKKGNALQNIDKFHQKLSKIYGFKILPKADRWNSINSLSWAGGQLLKDKRTKDAAQVFERRVSYAPHSIVALKSLSEAYEADGQLKKAIETQKKALKLAAKSLNDISGFEEKLAQLQLLLKNK